jgi:hypothetical protein
MIINNKSIRISVKYFAFILLSSFLFFACAKEVPVDDIDFQRQLVGGTGSYDDTKKTWKLDSLAIDGKAFALTSNQKKYTKTFNHDGTYSDSDGYSGSWEIATIDNLTHVTSGATVGTKITTKFQISEVNAAQFNMKLLNTTSKYEYFFVIVN